MRSQAPSHSGQKEAAAAMAVSAHATVDAAILGVLNEQGPTRIEQLVHALPAYPWRQIFTAVGRLRRTGVLRPNHPDPLTCYPASFR